MLLSAVLLISCEKEADIELPNVEKKLSVSCFISNDIDTIKAVVFWSRPVFSAAPTVPNDFMRDGEVIISNGETERILDYNFTTEQYELAVTDFPLDLGGSYTLIVRAPNGTVVRAQTRIPSVVPSVSSSIYQEDVSTTPWGEQQVNGVFRTYLNDLPGDNYYRLVYYDRYSPDENIFFINYLDESFAEEDNAQNGILYSEHEIEVFGYDLDQMKSAYIMLSGEDYFRYHRTLQNQEPGNPFAEPTLVFSNIEGGLGCFAGYTKTVINY